MVLLSGIASRALRALERGGLRASPRERSVLLLAAVLSLWNVWGYDLWAPDEPYFAEGAREMIVDGRFAVPRVGGEITTDKPPLFFWLIAFLSLPMGAVTSFTARFPSILAAIGAVALTMRLGRRLGGEGGGALPGAILALTYLFWDKSRSAQIDSLLSFLVLVALSAFEAHRAGDANSRRAGLLFWGAAAAAVIAKGPVGLLLPLGIALSVLAADRKLSLWKRFAPFAGPILFSAIVSAWALAATLGSEGEYSVWNAFREHALDRALHGMHHRQPPWYYAEILPVQLLPWSGLLPGALVLLWRRRREAADRFVLVSAAFVILFFSLSREKRDLYVLPAYPFFAIAFSRLLDSVTNVSNRGVAMNPRWVTLPLGITGGLFVLAAVALPLAVSRHLPGADPAFAVLAVVLAAGGAGMIAACLGGRTDAATAATVAATAVVFLTAASIVFPAVDPMRSARSFARRVREETAEFRAGGGTVVALGVGNLPEAIAFYSDGVYLREVGGVAELERMLDGGSEVYVVAAREVLATASESAARSLRVVHSAEISRRTILLASREPRKGALGSGPGVAAPPALPGE